MNAPLSSLAAVSVPTPVRRNARLLGLVLSSAVCALLLTLFWVRSGFALSAGTGFLVWHASDPGGCAEAQSAAGASLTSEPFVLPGSAPFGCIRWRTFWVVPRQRQSVFELDARGSVELSIDGRRVALHRTRPKADTFTGEAALLIGVHRVELLYRRGSAPGYLRVREQDLREAHYIYVLAPLQRERFFASETRAREALPLVAESRAWLPPACVALLSLCALLLWLTRRILRGSRAPWRVLACSLAIVVLAYQVRVAALPFDGAYTDELAYSTAGRHYVRNVLVGDYTTEAFRWNYPHPPLAKWLYGLAAELGGQDGARRVSALLGALSVGLIVPIGATLLSLEVGFAAAAIATFLPPLVAHSRLTGLESPVLFFWLVSVLAALRWAKSALEPGNASRGSLGDPWAAWLAPLLAVLGVGSRMTCVWVFPLLLAVVLYVHAQATSRQRFATLALACAGVLVGGGLLFALWPWLWGRPVEGWQQMLVRWRGQHTSEIFLGTNQRPPPVGYYAAAFIATTPAFVLLFGSLGLVAGLRGRATRVATSFLALWLLLPFAQSLSSFRQDLARYVIPAWPALALLAALGVDSLVLWLLARVAGLRRFAGSAGIWSVMAQTVLVVYVALALHAVEPYPLDYFSELVAGPEGVARSHAFELAWWGEGIGEAVGWVNANAPAGMTVRLAIEPHDVRPRLRDDLRERLAGPSDFVITNHYKFHPETPVGCHLAHRVAVRGAPLADVYDCRRPGR